MNGNIAKMDLYEYSLLPGVIRIKTSGNNDPILVDILSEIDLSNGRVYVEGDHYIFVDYEIMRDDNGSYIDLKVVNAN